MQSLLCTMAMFVYTASSLFTYSQVSHQLWDDLLKKHVSAGGSVGYVEFTKDDKARLKAYLNMLSENVPAAHWTKEASLAYWINLYNAMVVQLIIENYPVNSIQDLQPVLEIPGFYTVWHQTTINTVRGTYSLYSIEHAILRDEFRDVRIHFALNCASKSCPALRNEAYTGELLDFQLNDQARSFINNTDYNEISTNQLRLSRIFDWYHGDFTESIDLIDYLNRYSNVKISSKAKVTYKTYDWELNRQ